MSARSFLLGCVLSLTFAACRAPRGEDLIGVERSFTFRVEGNEELDEADIRRALRFELDEYEAGGQTPAFADDAAYQALLLYHQSGFPFAAVEYEQVPEEEPPGLVLSVVEGNRVTLDEDALTAKGVDEFSKEEVLGLIEAPRAGVLGRGEIVFVEDTVLSMLRALEEEYLARGYQDVEVEKPRIEFVDDDTRALVRFAVQEGPRYVCGRVRLEEGDLAVDLTDEIEAACRRFAFERNRAGEVVRDEDGRRMRRPYTPRIPFELRGELRDALGDRAYPEAVVVVDRDPADASADDHPAMIRVDLVVRIEPGPRIEVGRIEVVGNEGVAEKLVLSRMRVETGDPWRNEDLRESVRRLYRTGLFERVKVDPVVPDGEAGDDQRRDVAVELVEGPTRDLFLEPGYGSWELFRLRAGFRERNLWGSGRQLRVEGTAAVRTTRALISLRDPWLFESDLDLIGDLSLTYDERENPSFTDSSTGLGAFVTKEWTGRESTTFGYQYRRSGVDELDVDADEEDEDDIDISSLLLSHRRDLRDNPLLPSENYFVQATAEWGDETLGSQLDFLRTTLSIAGYRRIGERAVLATSYRTGIIQPLGDQDRIPIQERFFNGGENTVRSFHEDELGPMDDDGDPIGGEAYHVFNLELRRPLAETRLEIAAFYDVGNVAENASEWSDLDDLEYGVGLGLRYLLPVGPVRLDFATNPDAGDDEDEFVVHFAIGIAF